MNCSPVTRRKLFSLSLSVETSLFHAHTLYAHIRLWFMESLAFARAPVEVHEWANFIIPRATRQFHAIATVREKEMSNEECVDQFINKFSLFINSRNLHGPPSSTCTRLQPYRSVRDSNKSRHCRAADRTRVRTEGLHRGGAVSSSGDEKITSWYTARLEQHLEVGQERRRLFNSHKFSKFSLVFLFICSRALSLRRWWRWWCDGKCITGVQAERRKERKKKCYWANDFAMLSMT